jgi:hypothetical protein
MLTQVILLVVTAFDAAAVQKCAKREAGKKEGGQALSMRTAIPTTVPL